MFFFLKLCVWGGLFYLGHVLFKKDIKLPEIKKEIVLGVLVAVYAAVYFLWNLTRHGSFNTFALDVTVYLQALSNWSLYSFVLKKSLLSDHFSPLLLALVPVVKWLAVPVTLFCIQAIVLAGAAIPLYFLARRLEVEEGPALFICFLYLNYFYTRQMAFADFRVEYFMPLAFFTLFYLFLSKVDWKFWLVLLLCLTIKEDVGFYLCPWAVLIAIFTPEKRTPALVTAIIAFAGGILSLITLLPANKGVYPYFSSWAQYGQGIFGILGGALLNPSSSLAVFFKSEFLKMTLSMAVLPFCSFWGLALLVPVWIQLSSSQASQAGLKLYYAAPVVPFLFAALAAGWVKVYARFISFSFHKPHIVLGLATFLLVFNFSWITPFAITPEHRAAHSILKKIPKRGRVLAQANIAPHISRPNRVRVLGMNSFKRKPHFVIFHVKSNSWPFSRDKYLKAIDRMRRDPRYTIWKQESGLLIFLLKKE